ncbi:MAG: DNA-directed RNA polymerase subunit beta' [Candidatus Eisenbacteria bacterium]|nr:DNA-directed RNA polymerase subunit beta' [Candidatus Eisenbacteria bacterium]
MEENIGLQMPPSPPPGRMSLTRGEDRDRRKPATFNSIKIKLASPEVIKEWSYGEVTKPETINYRSFKPEKDGLFCEKIFGPVKDWECNCGKYKRIRYRGVVCDRCGVEVTQAKVRRERLGHIELAEPVAHIWFFKGVPSRIGHLLDMSIRDLERVLYYESYVVIDAGNTRLKPKELLSEDQMEELAGDNTAQFTAEMGGRAIRTLLEQIDLDLLCAELRSTAKIETSVQRKREVLKRLRVAEAFRKSGNRPEWMILKVVPVLPPDLRPLVPLEGGRFATSDLNDLYRRVINRNNRLKKLMDIKAPAVILRNEKRMLQEAVDALFDNGRRSRAVRGQGDRPLKSLSDMLKGKQGRFRQNLLGKRVDYSGRSVIVVGPELKLHQCGLPKNMALELFKPFIIRKLEDKGFVQTVKSAKRLVERERPEVWDILGEIIKGHPVLLNRAPTLHRLGIQGFEPVLVEGKAIKIHPLVCQAFNADFDGDQMAVHVPLSFEAQIEVSTIMLSSHNILSPANGRPLATPNQDIVLGCNYLTKARGACLNPAYAKCEAAIVADLKKKWKAKGWLGKPEDEERLRKVVREDPRRLRSFPNATEALATYDRGEIKLHERIALRLQPGQHVMEPEKKDPAAARDERAAYDHFETTAGRVLFNQHLHPALQFVNKDMDKKGLENLVGGCYRKLGPAETAALLDELKDLGFKFATQAGITVGIDDVVIPPSKADIVAKAKTEVQRVTSEYQRGVITENERYNLVIDAWSKAATQVEQATMKHLSLEQDGFNPIYMMAHSGSRGSPEQIRQLAGMRGLMAKPQKKITGGLGEIIESPVIRNFKEGLTVLEYFISTHGARKGLADTALKTADAGYLTRRLVDVAQDVIITEDDCGTALNLTRSALKEGEEVVESLSERIVGRVTSEDVVNDLTGEVLVRAGEEITEEKAKEIEDCGLERVMIRSVLVCESRRGVCKKCYGRNLATGRMVDTGEAVGVIAAQSIGEPGTQLTLRTFHIGGVSGRIAEAARRLSNAAGTVRFNKLETVKNRDGMPVTVGHKGEIRIEGPDGNIVQRFEPLYGATLLVQDGQEVPLGAPLAEWDPYNTPIVTEVTGTVKFIDIKEKLTMREELDENTSMKLFVIIEDREKLRHPRLDVVDAAGKTLGQYPLPTGARLSVRDGDAVHAGEIMAKIRRESAKVRDITGGLPRVAELLEARKPKDHAIVSEIDGRVEFDKVVRGMRKLRVVSDEADEREYLIPQGKYLHVQEGDRVHSGDRLTEGPMNPHDTLLIQGINRVQEYLVDEIQEVYRLQGVRIDDKHIEVIVRQMLQKVRIKDPGDTVFLEGEDVDKLTLAEENRRVEAEGGQPATHQPLLLGITKASLSTPSFISAASFQETTRVLTQAAVSGDTDELRGLKENVIIGHLIPAGTGLAKYRKIKVLKEDEAVERPEPEDAKTA